MRADVSMLQSVGSCARVLAALLLLSCADQGESIERKCERLRDHVIDLRMEGLPASDRDAHRHALKQALGERFADECRTFTAKQITCGLEAKDISDATACSGASAR